LERGNAQGDTTSPYIFNIGYQILIFKINYDLQIAGIIETPTVPPELQPPNLNKQVKFSSRKMFAFADDGNIVTTMKKFCLTEQNKKNTGRIRFTFWP
jgi:hypothetical protein